MRFSKIHGVQHNVVLMFEKIKKIRDEKGIFAAIPTDLSKAFETKNLKKLILKKNFQMEKM